MKTIELISIFMLFMSCDGFELKEFIDYRAGDTCLVIAVPHGGGLNPPGWKNRTFGTFETDTNTKELGLLLTAEIENHLGLRPHFISSDLLRSYLDVNRPIKVGAQDSKDAQTVHRMYHETIDWIKCGGPNKKSDCTSPNGPFEQPCLVIDLHGQSHRARVELGYLPTQEELNRFEMDADNLSIRGMCKRNNLSGKDALTGSQSLGALLEREGYPAVPSPSQNTPGSTFFFPGYYTEERHGSKQGGSSDAISVEVNRQVRIGVSQDVMSRFAAGLGRAISQYYRLFYL